MQQAIDRLSHRLGLLCLLVASFLSLNAHAQSFCFLSASTYYEQIYCELQAKGEARGLPPFNQFKRNDENIQAVILKRPAARIGIDLPMPKKRVVAPAVAQRPVQPAAPALRSTSPAIASSHAQPAPARLAATGNGLSACELTATVIECGDTRYALAGNRLNHRLSATALTDENRMALPVFTGSMDDTVAVNRYVSEAYRRYIEKMHDIGLAGATMTYGKFSFLFYDLHEKGLNFSQRFETMYGFLKKDKASMGVSEKLTADQQLSLTDCDFLSGHLLVCNRAGRNYLYLAGSELPE